MNLAFENVPRHRSANKRSGNIVEKSGEHEDNREQSKGPGPVARQNSRQLFRHATFFKMPREQRETRQQQKQVRQPHPFMLQVQAQPGEAGPILEAREGELIECNRGETGERDSNVNR